MDAKPVTESLVTYFRATPIPLICAYLFGSHARGEQQPSSDVDVAVLLPADVRPSLTGPLTMLRGDLERMLGRSVDLVDMRRAPVDLVHRVLRDGELLLDRDSGERVRFEVQARNEYFDLLPYIRRYRQGQAA